ncbi:MAG: hypothetical protein ACRD23_01805 [Terriglobales bacterium]
MPNVWDKLPEAPSALELNPLTNPVLEQNLGRWAKVYFSNPPAKRVQAVSDLLEEIKRESGADPAAKSDRPYSARDPKFQGPVCLACQHHNPPGHKFCSRCGKTLDPAQSVSTGNAGTPPIPGGYGPGSANDAQWLRDRSFHSLAGQDVPPRRAWRYMAGAFTIALAAFAYLQWASAPRARVPSATASARPQVSAPAASLPPASPVSETKRPPETPSLEPKTLEAQDNSASPEVQGPTPVPAGFQPAAQKTPLLEAASSRPTMAEPEDGGSDLRLAQRYLGGSIGGRNPSEAARLLWKAVSKQNATAAILLSDLYLRGDGVPRSCDQARLLLVAAARRGAPQAAQQLRNLELRGCL